MNLEIGDVVTLSDNNEYAVALTTRLEDKDIYYLTDIANEENFKIGYKDNNQFVEVKDEKKMQEYIAALNKEINEK